MFVMYSRILYGPVSAIPPPITQEALRVAVAAALEAARPPVEEVAALKAQIGRLEDLLRREQQRGDLALERAEAAGRRREQLALERADAAVAAALEAQIVRLEDLLRREQQRGDLALERADAAVAAERQNGNLALTRAEARIDALETTAVVGARWGGLCRGGAGRQKSRTTRLGGGIKIIE